MLTQPLPVSTTEPKPAPMRAKFTKFVSSKNVDRVRREIEVRYGFMPSEKYCRDLIKFVDEMTSEQKPST